MCREKNAVVEDAMREAVREAVHEPVNGAVYWFLSDAVWQVVGNAHRALSGALSGANPDPPELQDLIEEEA